MKRLRGSKCRILPKNELPEMQRKKQNCDDDGIIKQKIIRIWMICKTKILFIKNRAVFSGVPQGIITCYLVVSPVSGHRVGKLEDWN